MDISNRTLAYVAIAAFVLVACAVLMTVAAMPVQVALRAEPVHRVTVVPDVLREGGAELDPAGPLTVSLERGTESDSVLLACDQYRAERPIEARSVVFPSVPIGDCSIRLVGTKAPYRPVFPGDRVRCAAQGDRTACTGGLAHSRAGTLTVTSVAPADLSIDGVALGPAPVEGIEARVGERRLRLDYPDGRHTEWVLVVAPDQVISMHFPRPPAPDPATTPTEPVSQGDADATAATTASAP